jgi:SAM-dependent methyltransferase
MPFKIDELQDAYLKYRQFTSQNQYPYHERYIFPFFAGTYFTYRKVDVMRVNNIARSVSLKPSYVDIGCGYGDFLEKIREYLPNAIGIEKEGSIFYTFGRTKPDYIHSTAIEWLDNEFFDVAFVGWMEPGVDFRKYVAKSARCIVTTFDAGGQCGIFGGCEYEEFGFKKIACWRTPSWIDVNTELMNRYYTPVLSASNKEKQELVSLRTANNFWYVYSLPMISNTVIAGLKSWLAKESELFSKERFNFEQVLDECGFHYNEMLRSLLSKDKILWKVTFD